MANRPDPALFLGIDLGGTKTLAVAATSEGVVAGRSVSPTPANQSADEIVATIAATARAALADAGVASARAAAIAAAGAIVPSEGAVVWSPHIPAMSHTPVVALFRGHLDVPTAIGNDANLAALGEQRFGAGRGYGNVIFVTVSTGIGGGIVIDGAPYTGATGYAGEVGHMTVDAHGPYGKSMTPGAWESMCSGTAIERIIAERIESGQPSSLAGSAGSVTAEDVFAAMRAGDGLARSVIEDAIVYMAAGLTSLVNIIDPGILIIGGGLSNEWDAYIAPAVAIMRTQAFAGMGRDLPVVPPELGADAGALGAVALASTLAE